MRTTLDCPPAAGFTYWIPGQARYDGDDARPPARIPKLIDNLEQLFRIAPAILSHFLRLMCRDAQMPRWQDAGERPCRSLGPLLRSCALSPSDGQGCTNATIAGCQIAAWRSQVRHDGSDRYFGTAIQGTSEQVMTRHFAPRISGYRVAKLRNSTTIPCASRLVSEYSGHKLLDPDLFRGSLVRGDGSERRGTATPRTANPTMG